MYNVRDMGWMLKSMLIHQNDSKMIVNSNFVTLYLAFKGSIPIAPWSLMGLRHCVPLSDLKDIWSLELKYVNWSQNKWDL